MQENKNLIIAATLSMIVLLAWNAFYEIPRRQELQRYEQQKQQALVDKQKKLAATLNAESGTASGATPAAAATTPAAPATRAEAMNASPRAKLVSHYLHGSISLKGARLDDLTLAQYHEKLDPESPEVALLSPSGTQTPYFVEFGWVTTQLGLTVPDANTVWDVKGDKLTPGTPIELSWDNKTGVRFYISFSMDDGYMFNVQQRVENYGASDISLSPYALVSRVREHHPSIYILHEGPIGVFNKLLKEVTFDALKKEKSAEMRERASWLGISDKYWLTALVPSSDAEGVSRFSYTEDQGNERYQVDYLGAPLTVAAGHSGSTETDLFAGAKKLKMLEAYSDKMNITLFERAVDFGWFHFLTKPMLHTLVFFQNFMGNFGLAILLLTVVVKLCMFPLANKSYKSMSQMKKLHPQIMEIRDKHGSDRQKMNMEIMEFYKREKVNPMSGCLPLLVQIPVFFSLYKVLYVTIEMRHAPFYGWIHDLSAPDPTTIFNLFGLVAWTPPHFLPMIGIWPLLMTISMILMQKMNPPPTDPTQAMVIKLMPYFFLFIFVSFPAGLVIYWTWSNTLSIVQQWFIARSVNREMDEKPASRRRRTVKGK